MNKTLKYLTYGSIIALTVYVGYLFDTGELGFDTIMPTFGS